MLKFTKMTGIGNDYIYINCIINNKCSINEKSDIYKLLENIESITKKLSDRNYGVGSDGVILIQESGIADFKMRIFNSDGSEAKMCGNGIRCVGKYVFDNKLTNKRELLIETLSGIKKLKILDSNKNCSYVRVDMGVPLLNKDDVNIYIKDEEIIKKVKINIDGNDSEFFIVGVGNIHAVCFVDNVDNFDIEKYGKIVENYELFPNRANVEFVEILDKENIKVRVWERGSGETMACGTGACASVIASVKNRLTLSNVTVLLKGGMLDISLQEDNHVYMSGNASVVFDGELLLDNFIN